MTTRINYLRAVDLSGSFNISAIGNIKSSMTDDSSRSFTTVFYEHICRVSGGIICIDGSVRCHPSIRNSHIPIIPNGKVVHFFIADFNIFAVGSPCNI